MTTSRDDFDGKIDISIVLPGFNEEDALAELYSRLKAVLAAEGWHHKIILVNDGSLDRSWERIVAMADTDRAVKAVNLSRNSGHQIAITAGIDLSRGAAVVVMGADLQDPPALIPVLHAKIQERLRRALRPAPVVRGGDVVQARDGGALLPAEPPHDDPGDPDGHRRFPLMSRRVVIDLKEMNERSRFVRGLVTWVGDQIAVPYGRDRRYGGETKFSVAKMITFALDGITGFSSQPPRLASPIGLLFSIASAVLTVGPATFKLPGGAGLVQGWTSLAVAVLFLGGLQLLAIGILGEYVGRIHEDSKQRPLYLVRDQRNLATPPGPRDGRAPD